MVIKRIQEEGVSYNEAERRVRRFKSPEYPRLSGGFLPDFVESDCKC